MIKLCNDLFKIKIKIASNYIVSINEIVYADMNL